MKTQNKISGFLWGGKRIFFAEGRGKDISFERWRAYLYYDPNLAETVFFDTEKAYCEFIEKAAKHTFADFDAYRISCSDTTPPTPTPTTNPPTQK